MGLYIHIFVNKRYVEHLTFLGNSDSDCNPDLSHAVAALWFASPLFSCSCQNKTGIRRACLFICRDSEEGGKLVSFLHSPSWGQRNPEKQSRLGRSEERQQAESLAPGRRDQHTGQLAQDRGVAYVRRGLRPTWGPLTFFFFFYTGISEFLQIHFLVVETLLEEDSLKRCHVD